MVDESVYERHSAGNKNQFMMIPRLIKISIAFIALHSVAVGQSLKIATVDMERLFNEFHRTNEVQKEINIERARIQKDNNIRLADIRAIDDRMQTIRKQLKGDVGTKKRQDLDNEARELQQDGIHKERERTEFLERRNKALNEKMRKQMTSIFVELRETVSEHARNENFDYIFDKSGNSRQGVPFVLHAKEMVDLTEHLIKNVNNSAKKK